MCGADLWRVWHWITRRKIIFYWVEIMSEANGKNLVAKEAAERLPEANVEAQGELNFLFDGLQPPKTVAERLEMAKALRKRAVGRPKGSLNKSSRDNRAYCLSRGNMPFLDIVASRASMTIAELAEIEGLDIATAASVWKFCVEQYGEYTEKKMPKSIEADIRENKVVVVKKYVKTEDDGVTVEMADFRQISRGQDDEV